MSGETGAPPVDAVPLPDLRAQPRTHLQRTNSSARELPDPVTLYANLVEALKDRRRARGLSQARVDQIAGFPDALTAKYECGIRRPSGFDLCVWVASLNAQLIIAPLDTTRAARRVGTRRPWRRAKLRKSGK